MADDRQNRIRQRAHEIWEREGRPQGAHERHWQQAESEIATEGNKAGKKPATARKPAPAKAAKPAVAGPGPARTTATPAKPAAKPARAAAKPKAAAAKKG
jgi:hypothetical protein